MKSIPWTILAALTAVACASDPDAEGTGANGAGGSSNGGSAVPGTYADNFVQRARAPGPTFVEILEVRAVGSERVVYCSAVQGLNAVDMSDPDAPTLVYRIGSSAGSPTYPRCQHFALTDAAVYISNRGDEIQPTPFITVFDASTTPPTEGATYTEPGLSFEGLAAEGNLLFAAVHEDGLRILENDGTDLVPRGSVTSLINAWAVEAHEGFVYIADGEGGVVVVDAQNPASPTVVGQTAVDGSAQHIALDRDTMTAYVAAGAAGVVIVDVSDPTAPVQVGRADTPGTALQVAYAEGRAFVADWNDMRVYDVSDPAAPALMAVEIIDTGDISRVLGVGASGNLAFAGEWTGLYSYELRPEQSVPQIRLDRTQIDVGTLAPGNEAVKAVIVENEGPEPLVVSALEGSGLTVSTDSLPFRLEAGEKASVEVTLAGADTPTAGTLTIGSDDPDQAATVVNVVANTPTLGVGDTAPEVLVQLTTGGNWSLSDELGNVVVMSYFATF